MIGAMALFLAALLPIASQAAGTWATVTNLPPGGIALMLLLPNGSVMCQNSGNTGWYLLTPDTHGNYLNGTWTTLAPMHDSRRYYSSEVLPSGQVYVSGGEYGTGGSKAEMYTITNNTWTQLPTPPDDIIDNISETLPNGDILEGSPSADSRIFYVSSNYWSASIKPNDGQDEASWVKLQDGSILTIDPFGTNSERFVPSLNKWVTDSPVPVPMYGYGGELGCGLLLPTGQAIFFGASGSNCVYTPWTTNYAGTYTPNGTTNAGTWTTVATTPNFNAPIDAPAAMMVNGNILCCMGNTNNSYGSDSYFYEYNYVSNTWTAITSPTGGSSFSPVAYGCTMLDLPDGSVLVSGAGSQLYDYKPTGTTLTNAVPSILTVTTNTDGSFHMTGKLFTGISEGAAYGDDSQMNSDYPVARMTNGSGNTLYCRTYNWSTCNLMTGTNVVSCDMALPAGLLAGTFSLAVTANGIASAPYSLSINGTALPPVTGLGFTSINSNQMVIHWNDIGLTESGYFIQRSTNGVNYTTIASVGGNVTNYTDSNVTPLGQYYYVVLGTNVVGLGATVTPIFAASPAGTGSVLAAPWSGQDVGSVLGSGASGTNGGVYTVIGSGTGIQADNDQFQFACEPIAGDVTITARITTSQNTGSNALAGVMIRNSLGSDVSGALMAFNAASQNTIFEHRADSAGVAGYGLKSIAGDPDGLLNNNGIATSESGADTVTVPVWLRLVRSANTITGFTSPDGTTWTQAGTVTFAMSPVVQVGLAVTSGTYSLLNTSTFDNVTVTGTNALVPPPMAEWKLDETGGTNAEDSIDSFDGQYNNVTLGLAGATPVTGYAAGFNGTSANITVPALNLNSNVVTITTWMYRTVNEPANAGVFFNRANSTVSGIDFYNSANVLGYTWNNNASTYNWSSTLTVPSNLWTFVALVVTPTNAVMYMSTNGVLQAKTNSVANAVQAFDGVSYIGQDPTSSSRYFNGQLDQVQFFNRVLTPAQLLSLASTPGISFTTPVSGSGTTAPGTVNFTATLSATNGHIPNLVQFFNNGTFVGQTTTPPYTNSVTNLTAGAYALVARLYYDSGLTVDSDPDVIFVENAAGVPTNVVATALASNLVNIAWSAGTNATGYILSRNASPIATLAGTSYADYGVTPGVSVCYTVVATNLVSTSAASASSCVTPSVTGAGSLAWSAGGTVSGPQDGSGSWSTGTTAWWNGSANVPWTDTNVAILGAGTATNCTVTLANDITPSGLVFGVNGGGAYTIAGTNNIITSPSLNFAVDGNATILCPLYGTNNLVKNGSGTLTLSNASPSYVGTVAINGGVLVMPTGPSGPNIGYVIGTNGALYSGYSTGSGYSANVVIDGAGLSSSNGLHIACGTTFARQSLTLSNAPTLITSYGSGNNPVLQGFDINYDNLTVVAAASGSVIDSTVNINVNGSYGFRMNIVSGSSNAAGDLTVNGLLTGGSNPLYKYGTGSLRLGNTNTYGGGTIVSAGSLQVAAVSSALGSGQVTYNASSTLQAETSSTLPNNFSITSSSYTMTVDTLTNTLTITGAITNSGKLTKISAGTLVLAGANTYTGATTVSAGTLQVDGSLSGTTVTVASGATLAGTGLVNTAPTMSSGSTLSPGDYSGLGTLTFGGSLTLNSGSKTLMGIGKYGGTTSNDLAVVTGALAYAGTLTVTNIGTNVFAAGDSFQLFTAGSHSGGFSTVTLPTLSTNLAWYTNNLISSGQLTVVALPAITNQPAATVANTGTTAGFSVGATGSGTLAYQWRINGTNLTGATLSTLSLTNVQLTNAGNYTVVVTNSYGSVTSSIASLTVYVVPTISSSPTNLTVYVNSNALFNATASGTPTPGYQWQFNGTNLPGAIAAFYLVSGAQTNNEGGYSVVATNAGGSVTSSVASLSLYREYGCAPLPYPSLLASNGARHLAVPGYQLGTTNPLSTDARTNGAGQGGLTFSSLTVGGAGTVQVVATGSGYVNGWIDFNTNGSWANTGDQVFTNVAVVAGTNVLALNVPGSALVTTGAWARVRFSHMTNLTYTGQAPDGMVEDLTVAIGSGAPPLVSGGSMGTGGFSVNVTGNAGQTYVLLTATNLTAPVWVPVVTNVASTNGVFQLTDPNATNALPQQFYLIRSP